MFNSQGPMSRTKTTEALGSTKSQTMLFSNEIDEVRIETIKHGRKVFFDNEKKKLQEQVEDLTVTVNINKELMSEVFAPKSENPKEARKQEQSVLHKLNEENQYLLRRTKELYAENQEINGQMMLKEQIHIQALNRYDDEMRQQKVSY